MAKESLPDRCSFAGFVAEQEARMNADERAELEAWRAYYRGEGPSPGHVYERQPEPPGPVPSAVARADDPRNQP